MNQKGHFIRPGVTGGEMIAGKEPTHWERFLNKQVETHVQKDTDYNSRFMHGLIEHGAGIWAWEIDKKLDRIRSWLTRGELLVKGEGVDNAVGDIFNYTIQYAIFCKERRPLDRLSREDFRTWAEHLGPEYIICTLTREGRLGADESDVIDVLLKHMKGGNTRE